MAKIIGNPTVTPMAVPDWNQTDETKADFIKNKPDDAPKTPEGVPTEYYVRSSEGTWEYVGNITVGSAYDADYAHWAMNDNEGNIIHETYATKEEVGDIETALDNIIAIQNSLIGGDGE